MSDLFLIVSVINSGCAPWSYSKIRSNFSSDERYVQTLETIKSIRKYSANSKILLVDCSELSEEKNKQLETEVDYYYQLNSEKEINNLCHTSPKKGLGESLITIKAVEFIKLENMQFDRFFKISGRYKLDDRFDSSAFSYNEYTFCKEKHASPALSKNRHCTILYCVPKNLIDSYEQSLQKCYEFYLKSNTCLELLLPSFCEPKTLIPWLGVTGYRGVKSKLVII